MTQIKMQIPRALTLPQAYQITNPYCLLTILWKKSSQCSPSIPESRTPADGLASEGDAGSHVNTLLDSKMGVNRLLAGHDLFLPAQGLSGSL